MLELKSSFRIRCISNFVYFCELCWLLELSLKKLITYYSNILMCMSNFLFYIGELLIYSTSYFHFLSMQFRSKQQTS